MSRFEGKVAVVVGGASGIGRATSELFASEGATVVVADLNGPLAHETAAACGNSSIAFQLDVVDETAWDKLTGLLRDTFGGIDILANSAGFSYLENVSDATIAHWRRELDVNLTGTFLASQSAISLMKERGAPCAIVHVSSIYGLVGVAHAAAYCATKAGMTMLTKSIALHCADQKWPIRCNSVHPTYVDTPLLRLKASMYGGEEAMLASMAAEVPMGRIATPRDVADAIAFLSSDASALISGTTLVIDGAMTAGIPDPH